MLDEVNAVFHDVFLLIQSIRSWTEQCKSIVLSFFSPLGFSNSKVPIGLSEIFRYSVELFTLGILG